MAPLLPLGSEPLSPLTTPDVHGEGGQYGMVSSPLEPGHAV